MPASQEPRLATLREGLAAKAPARRSMLRGGSTIFARRLPSLSLAMRPASSISADSRCSGCGGITDALSKEDIAQYEGLVPDWSFTDDYTKMERRIRLKNFTVSTG